LNKPKKTYEKEEREKGKRTSAIELDGGLELNDGSGIGLGNGILELLEGLVVVGDVSLVVLLVVELHDFAADGWLECPIVVVEIR